MATFSFQTALNTLGGRKFVGLALVGGLLVVADLFSPTGTGLSENVVTALQWMYAAFCGGNALENVAGRGRPPSEG